MEIEQAADGTDHAVAAATAPLETLSVRELAVVAGEESDLVVPFKVELDGELQARMVQALVKYLLYLRGQIPCVYEEFDGLVRRQQQEEEAARVAGTRKRKLVSGGVKKARMLVDQVDMLLGSSLLQMFQRRVRSVVLVFGSTVASPRELWRVDFDGGSSEHRASTSTITGKYGTTLSRDRIVQLCVQKLIRSVLSYATQHFCSVATTSLHLLVFAERSSIPVDGFVPKQQFRLRLPKAKKRGKRAHVVRVTHDDSSAQSSDSEHSSDTNQALEDDFMWYQSARPLQGVTRMS